MDVHDKKTRSYNMSRIRNRDTKPELLVRKLCHSLGLRFRLQKKFPRGRPDLTLRKHKTVIFVHGCFWHSHSCKEGNVAPKTNSDFWMKKRNRTKERDLENTIYFESIGWRVITIWECETKHPELLKSKINQYFQVTDNSSTSS